MKKLTHFRYASSRTHGPGLPISAPSPYGVLRLIAKRGQNLPLEGGTVPSHDDNPISWKRIEGPFRDEDNIADSGSELQSVLPTTERVQKKWSSSQSGQVRARTVSAALTIRVKEDLRNGDHPNRAPRIIVDIQRQLWTSLRGSEVEVWREGRFYRRGLVDDAMPDASGFWLAADGCEGREFIGVDSGGEVQACLPASAVKP